MTMEQAVCGVYGPMAPRPGAEERMWSAIDRKLGGKAREIQICVHRRKHSRARLLLAAAAVLVLVLVSVFFLRDRFAEPKPPEPVASVPSPSPTPSPTPEPTPTEIKETRQIALVNAQVNDSPVLSVTDEGLFLARAVLPEGMTVDHWELNGEPVDAGERRFSLEFSSEGVKSVEAVLREERHVTCVNAYLQFLDEDGNPAGWMYEDVCFEYDYTVPTTGEEHPGGSITAVVLPIDPEAEEPYYWIIDGEKVWKGEGYTPAREIRLEELDRSVHIELVYQHGYRNRELSEPIVLTGSGGKELSAARPADDLPAEQTAEPANAVTEVDYVRDGVPLDPNAPGRDGHTHDWVLDEINSTESTCVDVGKHVYICSICGGKHVTWQEKKAHQFYYQCNASGHRKICSVCGTYGDPYTMYNWKPHSWVQQGDQKVCSICGWVYGSGS